MIIDVLVSQTHIYTHTYTHTHTHTHTRTHTHHTVVGWIYSDVYAIANSDVEVYYATLRGSIAARYVFEVEYISNSAS